MSDGHKQSKPGEYPLAPWAECDFFCIHDYAGSGASPCGWRGRLREAALAGLGGKLLCPKCGCATLLRLPADREGRSV